MRDLLPIAREHQERVDENLRRYTDDWRLGGNSVSCDTCTECGCCKQLVTIDLFEAVPIVDRLKRDGRDTPAFRKRLRAEAEAMKGQSRDRWFDGDHDCVFLEDGRCSIYEQRPTSCRSYFVASDPSLCSPPTRTNIGVLGCVKLGTYDALRLGNWISRHFDMKHMAYIDMLPRVVLRVLAAWDRADWPVFVDRQPWATEEQIERILSDSPSPTLTKRGNDDDRKQQVANGTRKNRNGRSRKQRRHQNNLGQEPRR